MSWSSDFDRQRIDISDPNPWLALYLDRSLPVAESAKFALLRGHNTWSRRLLLPLIRPVARGGIALVQLLRMVLPESWRSSYLLHQTIYWGLSRLVQKDANTLILRHFNIGTELLRFIAANVPGIRITSTVPLQPRRLQDLKNDTFLIHDLNIYNFMMELNQQLRADDREIMPPAEIDFSAISDDDMAFEDLPDGRCNVIDLQTAIEAYTPLYALLLSDHDFWRASNSLQLDETVAIYISRIMNDMTPLALVSNRHPMVPISTLQAGYRLMLHGLDAETLHGYLRQRKRQAQAVKMAKA